jgi:hypothetical protein
MKKVKKEWINEWMDDWLKRKDRENEENEERKKNWMTKETSTDNKTRKNDDDWNQ